MEMTSFKTENSDIIFLSIGLFYQIFLRMALGKMVPLIQIIPII